MAEDFETWICSDNWWNTARNGFSSSLSPCSRALKDIRSFEWPVSDMDVIKERSWEEPGSGSSGSVVTQVSDSINGADVLTDSTLPVVGNGLSSPAMDWSQDLFPSGGRDESKIHGNFQDPSLTLDFRQKAAMDPNIFAGGMEDLSENPDLNLDKTCLGLYECPTTFSQGFFEPHLLSQQPTYCNGSMTSNEISTSWPKLPQFIKNPLPEQQSAESLQFANDLPFSTTSAATMNGFAPSFYPSLQAQFSNPDFQAKPNCTTKRPNLSQQNTEVSDWNSTTKKNGNGPTLKKPRIGVSSPLPTFKVRKEKLGDRITALQQLVSPFGKTDTASVLFEAIDYIKFLHGQVSELSKPYMKNGVPIQQHQRVIQNPEKSNGFNGPKQDLRSRGLCLVPITSTFSVTSEIVPDFWTATFGGFPAILRN